MNSTQTCWMLAKVLKLCLKVELLPNTPVNVQQGVSCAKKTLRYLPLVV